MNRFAPAVLALTLVVSAPILSRAQDDGGDQAPPPSDQASGQPPAAGQGQGQGLARLQKRLGLSDDEFAKLKKAMDDHRAVIQPLQKKDRELVRTLAKQVRSKADDADIQKTLDSLKQSHKDVQAANDQFEQQLSFLTPTQRAKLLLGALMRMRHGQGMGRGMGQGGGHGPRNGPRDQQQPEQGGGDQGGQ